ncbi:DUF6199 family natural product biosynthesis protein [Streptomyces sp. NPDC091272]|uniref:DUF6199 family natural product biosynthesis protein n=1 Tax=Streptomyces sp. NPDC091272 TaxID=3365981 RepID=UPI0037FBEFF1
MVDVADVAYVADVVVAAKDGSAGPMFWVILSIMLVMGLVQVIRPQLVWRMNRTLRRPFVRDVDASEPSGKGYLLYRVTGVVFLVMLGVVAFSVLN